MRKETIAIFGAGLLQGIAMIAFPAAATIFTSPDAYHFSNTMYGSLFIPEALFSILAALMNPALCRFFSVKAVFVFGLVANLMAMLLLAFSVLAMKNLELAHFILLVATACIGIGFGLTVPTLNAMTALLFPNQVDAMLLILNALLGVGTALAPALIALFVAFGFWWGLPLVLAFLIGLLMLYSIPLALPGGHLPFKQADAPHSPIPLLFWIFAAFALLYGIVETLNGNWLSIYLKDQFDAPLATQSFALAIFWGMVTFGRLFFAAIRKLFREQLAFQLCPFICALAFLLVGWLPGGETTWAVFAFGLAGFGCSALLPLTISFGSEQLKSMAGSIPGMVISFYLIGYGIAAFGVGPLQEIVGVGLRDVYMMGVAVAFVLGLLSLYLQRGLWTKK